jgi:PAS domain-containing protein
MNDSSVPAVSASVPASASASSPTSNGRILSVDALRGFDMFWIIGAEEVARALDAVSNRPVVAAVTNQLRHVEWAGLSLPRCDFPVVSIPRRRLGGAFVGSRVSQGGTPGRVAPHRPTELPALRRRLVLLRRRHAALARCPGVRRAATHRTVLFRRGDVICVGAAQGHRTRHRRVSARLLGRPHVDAVSRCESETRQHWQTRHSGRGESTRGGVGRRHDDGERHV